MSSADEQFFGSVGVLGPLILGDGSNTTTVQGTAAGLLVNGAAVSGGVSGAPPNPPMSTGLWYGANGTTGTGSTGSNGRCVMHRAQFGRSCTLNGIAVDITIVSVTAGAVVRFGMYTDVNGLPTALVQDFGTAAADGSIGVASVVISQAVTVGKWYWVAISEQLMAASIATLRVPTGAPVIPAAVGTATAGGAAMQAGYYFDTGFGGAFPASAGAPSGTLAISNCPSYWVKAA